jgi:hypothetical protein
MRGDLLSSSALAAVLLTTLLCLPASAQNEWLSTQFHKYVDVSVMDFWAGPAVSCRWGRQDAKTEPIRYRP